MTIEVTHRDTHATGRCGYGCGRLAAWAVTASCNGMSSISYACDDHRPEQEIKALQGLISSLADQLKAHRKAVPLPTAAPREYELTEERHAALIEACHAVPYIIVGGQAPPSAQENANREWAKLGEELGFDAATVRPVPGKGSRFFMAVPRAR